MAKSVVGLFDAATNVESVKRDLEQMGVSKRHIHALDHTEAIEGEPRSWTDRVGAFFGFTGDQRERDIGAAYADAMNEGDTLLIVDVDDTMADRTAAVMNQYGALDIGARDRMRGAREIPSPPESRTIPIITDQTTLPVVTEQATLPVIEEELEIGKRTIERGGVRVHSYVEEMPVEEVIRLREEHVNVERHAASRPVTAAETFQETTIVVTETAEQPVVAKQARVVEEVVIGNTTEEREETITETIRRQDIK